MALLKLTPKLKLGPAMFTKYIQTQYTKYNEAKNYFLANPSRLIELENFLMNEILHFIDLKKPEIIRDYNEASYLYPFWKNYPPEDRGRAPTGEQIPWIEVGEQVFGNKLSRYFANNFCVKDSGLPSGSDDRCIIASERIRSILDISDSAWVFVDIKSAGPRDNYDHAVMSPYQVSGSGDWTKIQEGVHNSPIRACGKIAQHNFLCSLSPIYVLSDGTVAPLVNFVIKPVYKMQMLGEKNIGQPLDEIKVACIPNGLLLTASPAYLKTYPDLFYPGKDDHKKNPNKARARVSFELLREINPWRVKEIK